MYQETLVARSPETLSFDVTPGPRSWLDLSLGMIEEGALTFRVGRQQGGGAEETILETTLTTANRGSVVRSTSARPRVRRCVSPCRSTPSTTE